jgi:hypothetical protein
MATRIKEKNMFPSKGDSIKFTDNFLDNSPLYWTAPYRDVELEVVKVKLLTMVPRATYRVNFLVNGMMLRVNIDRQGHYVNAAGRPIFALTVFEPYSGKKNALSLSSHKAVAVPAPAWAPHSPPQPKSAPSEDDRCKKCGTMGDVKGMCCTCPSCGNTIWGA